MRRQLIPFGTHRLQHLLLLRERAGADTRPALVDDRELLARLAGDDGQARAAFDRLLKNKDTAFLGLRGLLVVALVAVVAAGCAAQRFLGQQEEIDHFTKSGGSKGCVGSGCTVNTLRCADTRA